MFLILGSLVVAGVFTLAGMLYSHDDKRLAIWTFFVAGAFTLFMICKVWADSVGTPLIKPSEPIPAPTPSTDPARPSTIAPIAPSATATTPPGGHVPSPVPTTGAITLNEIDERFRLAEKRGRTKELKKSLDGVRVDWTFPFFAANEVGKNIRISLRQPETHGGLNLVTVWLPKKGNERLLTMGTLDVFRVRGEIDGDQTDSFRVTLKGGAKLEYVRTDPDEGRSPGSSGQPSPAPTVKAETSKTDEADKPRAVISLRDLESLTHDQVLERFWAAGSGDKIERIGQAILGMNVDWTLTLQSVSSYSNDRFFISLTGGRDSEGKDRPEDKYHLGLVAFRIPKKGNERFPLLEEYKQRIRVRGKIASVAGCNIILSDTAEFELA